MDSQVLVAYATKHGATREIADWIARVLSDTGLHGDVRPVGCVGELVRYDAVVLGSGVYVGRWRKEAVKFLRTNEALLAEKPVWLFSSGPTGEGDPVKLTQGWRLPPNVQRIADRIAPCDIAVFRSALDIRKLNFIEKWIIKKVKAPVGDFRDQGAIACWAADIASELKAGGRAQGTRTKHQKAGRASAESRHS